ncbi:MAG: hypothetical protein A3C79_01690 [Candidatus Taylorbacteria bacterium RIFCSPHIGHO2_02_FULL_45_28]|uniref:Uncharacterized protein n=1 Tax=Candidatus Taylorbacteria bacterium RIFCSPHIGHO2_12_FULL_45_16 TaxID=1802315 RepID=A0A1G2MYL8_9BACT|nr:MAG: hypothetical protein A2830_03845 [Candidatus Taylorbacteria bacterium RIFCSPHIGHO2_01_FULL_44_110]OHA25146.1 MAG: hypothetical protein A3C79_01690 [Candidatus Taylorbacteria bacterium RIFCSPHIGHO2_02_FULL_45_28]OHA29025.1 MAG: hypothetical protein A3F51_02065 [Candidatus Taylorbacteria bacterium RIFCSPHIGHO2_12_FULL_45_16]OHA33144.1 MAG: hypothetical protein A3A23_03750 [Candidatus Taylorbacteria bacterium RIFCSPLOWO2_01_FULL_45_59]OHA39566.1 MAG: hypothetical protein A3I98_00330 [Candi
MKKSIVAIVLIIIAIVLIVIYGGAPSDQSTSTTGISTTTTTGGTVSPSAPVSGTTKVSSQTSEYHNAELGFSVKYPTVWEKTENSMSVSFIIPIDKAQVSTVAKLQVDVNVISGKCAFPPVTTVKDRGTLKVGSQTLNTISMSNTVQGRGYFNRMYSLQKDSICYMFALSSITLDPATKGLTGSNITQAQNNNKALINSADVAFTDMVKSFGFVAIPQGIDETKAPK